MTVNLQALVIAAKNVLSHAYPPLPTDERDATVKYSWLILLQEALAAAENEPPVSAPLVERVREAFRAAEESWPGGPMMRSEWLDDAIREVLDPPITASLIDAAYWARKVLGSKDVPEEVREEAAEKLYLALEALVQEPPKLSEEQLAAHDPTAFFSDNGNVTVTCACGKQFQSVRTERPDAGAKQRTHRAAALNVALAGKGG